MVPGASRGEGSVQKESTELGTVLQPRGEEGFLSLASLGALRSGISVVSSAP